MQRISLHALAKDQLERATAATSGRTAETVVGGHERILRQTVIGIRKGTTLGDYDSPGEGTIHVLIGRIRMTCGPNAWEARTGTLLKVPASRHGLYAMEDSAILLTVAKAPTTAAHQTGSGGGRYADAAAPTPAL